MFLLCFPRNLSFDKNSEILQVFHILGANVKISNSAHKVYQRNTGKIPVFAILSFGKYCKYHGWLVLKSHECRMKRKPI